MIESLGSFENSSKFPHTMRSGSAKGSVKSEKSIVTKISEVKNLDDLKSLNSEEKS